MNADFDKRYPLVRVEWVDSCGIRRWSDNSSVKELTPLDCVSVGWVLRDDETSINLVSSNDGQGEDSNVDGIQCIPRSAVRKVEHLRISRRGSKKG